MVLLKSIKNSELNTNKSIFPYNQIDFYPLLFLIKFTYLKIENSGKNSLILGMMLTIQS